MSRLGIFSSLLHVVIYQQKAATIKELTQKEENSYVLWNPDIVLVSTYVPLRYFKIE